MVKAIIRYLGLFLIKTCLVSFAIIIKLSITDGEMDWGREGVEGVGVGEVVGVGLVVLVGVLLVDGPLLGRPPFIEYPIDFKSNNDVISARG